MLTLVYNKAFKQHLHTLTIIIVRYYDISNRRACQEIRNNFYSNDAPNENVFKMTPYLIHSRSSSSQPLRPINKWGVGTKIVIGAYPIGSITTEHY